MAILLCHSCIRIPSGGDYAFARVQRLTGIQGHPGRKTWQPDRCAQMAACHEAGARYFRRAISPSGLERVVRPGSPHATANLPAVFLGDAWPRGDGRILSSGKGRSVVGPCTRARQWSQSST